MTHFFKIDSRFFFEILAAVSAVVLVLIYFFIIWISPTPQFQDINEWIFHGFLLSEMLSGGRVPVEIKPYPIPNSITQIILGFLGVAIHPIISGKVLLTALLSGVVFVAYRAASCFSIERRWQSFLIFISILLGSAFLNGYSNYLTGTLLLLLYLTLPDLRRNNFAITMIFSIIIFFCHAFSLLVFFLVILMEIKVKKRSILEALGVLPSVFLCIWYFTAEHSAKLRDENLLGYWSDWMRTTAYKLYTIAKHGPYHNFLKNGVSELDSSPYFFWFGVGLNLIFALMICYIFIFSAIHLVRTKAAPPIALTGITCFVLFLVFPRGFFPDIVNPGERILTPGILMVLFWASSRLNSRFWSALFLISLVSVSSAVSLAIHSCRTDPSIYLVDLPTTDGSIEDLFGHSPDRFNYRYNEIISNDFGAGSRLHFGTSILRMRQHVDQP